MFICCLPMLYLRQIEVCVVCRLSAFLLLRHTCVFCSTLSRRESLPFSDENKSYFPLCVALQLNWMFSLFLHLCQISKKDAGVYEVILKDDRGKDTSTLNLTDQGNLPESHAYKKYLLTVPFIYINILFQVSKTWWMKFSVSLVRRNSMTCP